MKKNLSYILITTFFLATVGMPFIAHADPASDAQAAIDKASKDVAALGQQVQAARAAMNAAQQAVDQGPGMIASFATQAFNVASYATNPVGSYVYDTYVKSGKNASETRADLQANLDSATKANNITQDEYNKANGSLGIAEDYNNNQDYVNASTMAAIADQQAQQGVNTSNAAQAQAKADAQKATATEQDKGNHCFPVLMGGGGFEPGVCLTQIFAWIGYIILAIAALFLYIVSLLFDWIIAGTVAGMSGIVTRVGVIGIAWGIVRDIGNAFFIFILLYLSIATILDLGVETKRQVVRVITMALLINFSLFFTNVMIDASNIVATGFYNATIQTANDATNPKTHPSLTNSITGGKGGIAAVFMNAIAFQEVYSIDNTGAATSKATAPIGNDAPSLINKDNAGNLSFGRIIATTFFGTFFMFTTGLVFLASITLFAQRVATLIICMVVSPLAFALMAVPNDRYAKTLYWDKLVPQLLFAPVYMLFLFITVKIVASDQFTSHISAQNLAGTAGLNTSDPYFGFPKEITAIFTIFYNFIIINTLLITTLVSAKELGVEGAEGAIKWVGESKTWLKGALHRQAMNRIPVPFMGGSMRDLNERFKESRYAKLPVLGDFLQKYSTGVLVDTQFGGKSAEEAHQEELHFAQETKEIEHGDSAIKAAGEIDKMEATRKGNEGELGKLIENAKPLVKKEEDLEKLKAEAMTLEAKGVLTDEEKKKLEQNKAEQEARKLTDAEQKTLKDNRDKQASLKEKIAKSEAKEYELQDSIERNLTLVGGNFDKLGRKFFLNEKIMGNASEAQIEALLKSDKYTDEEKREFLSKRYDPWKKLLQPRKDWYDRVTKYKERISEIEKEKGVSRLEAEELAAKEAEEERLDTKKGMDMSKRTMINPDNEKDIKQPGYSSTTGLRWLRRKMRSATVSEWKSVNFYDPGMFEERAFGEIIKMSGVGDIRRSSDFTTRTKENLRRYVKPADIHEALDDLYGIPTHLSNTEKADLREEWIEREKNMTTEEGRKEYEAAIIKRFTGPKKDETGKVIMDATGKPVMEFNEKAYNQRLDAVRQVIGGKSKEEMGELAGELTDRLSPFYSKDNIVAIRKNKDIGEIRPIAVTALLNVMYNSAPGSTLKPTAESVKLVNWMRTIKEGKDFFSGPLLDAKGNRIIIKNTKTGKVRPLIVGDTEEAKSDKNLQKYMEEFDRGEWQVADQALYDKWTGGEDERPIADVMEGRVTPPTPPTPPPPPAPPTPPAPSTPPNFNMPFF
ncbi:MAG: hypothetical protein PHV42_02040 [Candidatus Pacebacteria bacterium]|nr:hypothetical protein [Candidatus Paceibacterota bacterium]